MQSNVIKVTDIYKSFSIKSGQLTPVLKGLSTEIRKGEFVALTGPSGVGKSTLLYLIGSLDTPDSGGIEISIDNKQYIYSKMSSDEIALFRNKHIGFVFQSHHLLPEFTALENVMMPALISGVPFNHAQKKALSLLSIVGVDPRAEHKPMELSGGEQQRVAIARALMNDPALVLADEPTGNLDQKNAESVLNLLQSLRKSYPVTFLIATHSKEVAGIAERILAMSDGKITSGI